MKPMIRIPRRVGTAATVMTAADLPRHIDRADEPRYADNRAHIRKPLKKGEQHEAQT